MRTVGELAIESNRLFDENKELRKQIAELKEELKETQEGGFWGRAAARETIRANAAEEKLKALAEMKMPASETWRSIDAVRAQNAYRVLVEKSLKAIGISRG